MDANADAVAALLQSQGPAQAFRYFKLRGLHSEAQGLVRELLRRPCGHRELRRKVWVWVLLYVVPSSPPLPAAFKQHLLHTARASPDPWIRSLAESSLCPVQQSPDLTTSGLSALLFIPDRSADEEGDGPDLASTDFQASDVDMIIQENEMPLTKDKEQEFKARVESILIQNNPQQVIRDFLCLFAEDSFPENFLVVALAELRLKVSLDEDSAVLLFNELSRTCDVGVLLLHLIVPVLQSLSKLCSRNFIDSIEKVVSVHQRIVTDNLVVPVMTHVSFQAPQKEFLFRIVDDGIFEPLVIAQMLSAVMTLPSQHLSENYLNIVDVLLQKIPSELLSDGTVSLLIDNLEKASENPTLMKSKRFAAVLQRLLKGHKDKAKAVAINLRRIITKMDPLMKNVFTRLLDSIEKQ